MIGGGGGGRGMAVRFGLEFEFLLVAKLLDLFLFELGALEESSSACVFFQSLLLLHDLLLQEVHLGALSVSLGLVSMKKKK